MRHRQFNVVRSRISHLAAGLLLALSQPAAAQFQAGLLVGPSLTNISGSFVEESQLTAGLYIGALIEWQFAEHWAAESGFTSVQAGAFSVKGVGVDGLWDVRTSSIQLPFRLRYLVPFADDKWVFGPYVGGAVNLAGSCMIREAGFPAFDDECSEDTALGSVTDSDFLYSIGVVFDRAFNTSAFGFDFRYSRGTSDVFTGSVAEGFNSRSSTFDFKIRLVFPHFGESRW